jgi:ATP-binding cassette subfamily B protein
VRELYSLKKYFVKYKRSIFLGLFFIILSNLFAILIPPIVRESIDGIVLLLQENKTPEYIKSVPAMFQSQSGLAVLSGLLILGAALLKGVCLYFMRMTIIIMSRKIEYDQKNEIFRHYQNMGQAFFSKNYTGDLMNRISDDVSKVRMFTGPAIMYALNLSCMILLVVSLMFYVNTEITFYVLIPLPILAITIYFVSDTMNKKSDLIQKKLSRLTTYVQETFAGVQVVKSYAAEKDFSDDFLEMNRTYRDDNMALVKVNGIFMPAVLGLIGMSILITLYVGGNAVIAGQFTLGNIVEYVIYVNMLTWPVASLGYVTSLVQRGAASQKRINEFLDEEPIKNEGKLEIEKIKDGIEFKNVWFKYPGTESWVLKDINFKIAASSKFGIIGTTGSGKSTISKLILGIYQPTKGEIMIDGVELKAYDKQSLGRLFGYVSQDIFLFSETLRDNILFGRKDDSDEEHLESAIESASLNEEIVALPEGLETILGERGITLSGGQKQRTAIARALIKKPNILLIDDGLSAVDTKTEVAIKSNLDRWNENQTFINISHRISTIQDSDLIIFLDKGRIIEMGKHTELLATGALYQELFEKQMMSVD